MGLRSRNKVSVEFSMSSMTDIVFLLLIFFIIVSTMVSPNALKVLLPTSAAKTTAAQTVSVTITPDVRYYVNGSEVDVSALELHIKEKIGNTEKKGIVLHADKSVPLEHAVKVMDIASRNKYDLVLATKPK
jgi:biopolymer transport protein ExbD